ncbi:MAG: DUF1549 domain-containing protein [Gemmataceae bacterium]|nr:DUF1549 domain-containing protein [Gemmataceae bacterium]
MRVVGLLSCALALVAPAILIAAEPVRGKLIVHPEKIELVGATSRHAFLVTQVQPDGSRRDVTAKAKVVTSNPAIVRLEKGEAIAAADGTCDLQVELDGLAAQLPVTVRDSGKATPPSFRNDIEPLLTRFGCNMGQCHGKGAGQNGFRLSLRGYAAEWDYFWITREFDSRRVNSSEPDASLLLRKPLGLAPHEGGKLWQSGGREHQLVLDWIKAGVPGISKEDLALKNIEILPGNRILRVGEEQQLLVQAEFADGLKRDVTWLTQFVSNDGLAEVSPTGLVKIVRPGETAIRATFLGQVSVITVASPYDQKFDPATLAKKNNFIDEHVFAKLAELKVEASELCSDETFIRRVFLDAIGLPPTAVEIRTFLADRDATKRAKLIDRLLERPEFVDFWTLQLSDLLQNRKEADHDVRGAKGVRDMHNWIRGQVAINRPWDEMARELLTTTGDVSEKPAVGYYIVNVGEHRDSHKSTIVANAAQTFLGARIGCAQCHNHPSEKYTQDDYYHFAGFFSRIRLDRKDPKQGVTKLMVSTADQNQNKQPVGVSQPRTNQFLPPRPLDRTETPVKPGEDPREKLAQWITNPNNEHFAGAMVNRLWAHFMGVGLVEPIDDLRVSNPPSNPGLWKALGQEFVAKKFDRRHMIRTILNSRTYQLSSETRRSNERDLRFYSHYYARRLPAEVMLDAISQATGVPEKFEGYPVGLRAAQVPDPAVKSYFLGLFGRSERITACACERNNEVTLPQLLHVSGGTTIGQKIADANGRLTDLLKAKKSDTELVDELFLTTLCRLPRSQERQLAENDLKSAEPTEREQVFRDLFWVLMNTKEFAFNH